MATAERAPKPIRCTLFSRGLCRLGDLCPWAHGASELLPPVAAAAVVNATVSVAAAAAAQQAATQTTDHASIWSQLNMPPPTVDTPMMKTLMSGKANVEQALADQPEQMSEQSSGGFGEMLSALSAELPSRAWADLGPSSKAPAQLYPGECGFALHQDDDNPFWTPFGGIHPDVEELCQRFDIDERAMKRLNECMCTRRLDTWTEDLERLWEDCEHSKNKGTNPTALLMKKVTDMYNGVFVAKTGKDKDVRDLAKKYKFDDEAKRRLEEAVVLKDPDEKKKILKEMHAHLDITHNTSKCVMRLLSYIMKDRPLPHPTEGPKGKGEGKGKGKDDDRKGKGKGDRDRDDRDRDRDRDRRDDRRDRRDDRRRDSRSRSRGRRRD